MWIYLGPYARPDSQRDQAIYTSFYLYATTVQAVQVVLDLQSFSTAVKCLEYKLPSAGASPGKRTQEIWLFTAQKKLSDANISKQVDD
jgi:hypothetical protein